MVEDLLILDRKKGERLSRLTQILVALPHSLANEIGRLFRAIISQQMVIEIL